MNIIQTEKSRKRANLFRNLAMWCGVFIISVTILTVLDIAPPEIKEVGKYFFSLISSNKSGTAILGNLDSAVSTANTSVGVVNPVIVEAAVAKVNPVRVMIKKIGVNSPVANPESTEIKTLDDALLRGVVRYPGSGTLEDNFNIFLFGHSSYLSVVNNQSFKAFNRLQELQLGDEIFLFSDSRQYSYKVTKAELVDENEALINFSDGKTGKKKVILSTCDTFGKKTDRFVVEATFSGSRPI